MDGIQVPPDHYDWPTYNIKGRWISYWHLVDERRVSRLASGPASSATRSPRRGSA